MIPDWKRTVPTSCIQVIVSALAALAGYSGCGKSVLNHRCCSKIWLVTGRKPPLHHPWFLPVPRVVYHSTPALVSVPTAACSLGRNLFHPMRLILLMRPAHPVRRPNPLHRTHNAQEFVYDTPQ